MSKTTQKYGKPTFVAYVSSEIPAQPSERVLWGWKKLDEYSQREFGKNYDNLKDAQKSALHLNINEGKYDKPEVKAKAIQVVIEEMPIVEAAGIEASKEASL